MRLHNQRIIVTGGGSGFGKAMSQRFAEEGARLLLADFSAERGMAVVEEIRRAGGEAHFCQIDVAQADQVKAMVAQAVTLWGGLDVMVNNAGYTHATMPLDAVSEADYDRVFAVNVKSIYLSSREVVPLFRAQGEGVILNTASTAGLRPRPNLAWYNASKGAVITLTKSMAIELAPAKVRVNCLCPVVANTPMLGDFIGDHARNTPETRAAMGAGIPLGRLTEPQDVANAALYLVSDEAQFITGVALEVDGGRCIS
ncbi:MAG: glucose 1-dehydrogenase [Pseudomonadales bacterium]|jgi:3-oxoacyl-[acyl-carrier protein] reductase|nr:glucose 1-dehydrogenase [Pseudomonadales bacterium]MCC6529452.1 glucose 1-dehydrogenase [Pseudomonadales bacterium]MCP5332049.1 glucose 1-dehydrogenase [Pseudomonadales bacterium]HMU90944.1 glucose 1-dehydrogenase [Pseudomonadales bacterium]HMW15962.1 glucose 1-dehydrogenase [Pseudomonadales bacterium]